MTSAPGPLSPPAAAAGELRSGGSATEQQYLLRMLGALFPLTAGAILYGWRGMALMALLVLCTLGAMMAWRRIGPRGGSLHLAHGLWLAVLLGLMLPAQLLNQLPPGDFSPVWMSWAIVPGAGILLVCLMWLSGGVGFSRFHPALATYLLLALAFGSMLNEHFILHRHKLLGGDIAKFAPISDPLIPRDEPWIYWNRARPADAVQVDATAAENLSNYTRGRGPGRRAWFSINGLLHDAMPPMQDLVVAGHPGPMGISSAIAVLVGGLFLMYRGAIRGRVPLLTVVVTYLWLLVLPIPVAITATEAQWRSVALPGTHIDWQTILTFGFYQVLASPLLFAALFLATDGSICPMGRRAQTIYAIILGSLAAAAQLYVSCSLGPYLALLLVSQISPWLEKHFGAGGGRHRGSA